jgi:hypothetical protein
MKFFVPATCCRDEAEEVWEAVRDYLAGIGLVTRPRRIRALSLAPELSHMVEVGLDLPNDPGLVAFIFEAANVRLFYVCTLGHGVFEGAPWILALSERGRVVEFEPEAEGRG